MSPVEEPSQPDTGQPAAGLSGSTSLVVVAWLWSAVAMLFVVLSIFASFFDRFPGDERLTNSMQRVDVPAFGGFLDFVNALGDGWIYVILTLAMAFAFAFRRAGVQAVFVLATFAPPIFNSLVKGWVERPRPSPELVDVSHRVSGFSFPSGHAVGISVLFGLLFFLIPAAIPWRLLRWTLQAGCLLLVLAVGPARVYVGVHWPSDVFGGYVLALLFLMPALFVYRALRRSGSQQ